MKFCPDSQVMGAVGRLDEQRNTSEFIRAAATVCKERPDLLIVMTSRWAGLPVALVEAMSAGKEMVANDVDGVSEVVIDGETGSLVPPHRPEDTARRILQIRNDENLRRRMERAALERSERFSVKRMGAEAEAFYRQLIGAKTTP